VGICLSKADAVGWRPDSQRGTSDVLYGSGLGRSWDLVCEEFRPKTMRNQRLIFVNPPYDDPAPWMDMARSCATPTLVLVNLSMTKAVRSCLQGGARLGLFNKRLAFIAANGKPKPGYDRDSCLLAMGRHAAGDLVDPNVRWFRGINTEEWV
jgi:hypothetical protein